MHTKAKRILPIVAVVIVILLVVWFFAARAQANQIPLVSGTIEAVDVRIAPELSGRVIEVLAQEGDAVQAGDPLVRLDDTLLQAQRDQAQASLDAAQANLDLLKAGSSDEQLAVAQAAVDAAQIAADAAQETVDDLPSGAEDTTAGKAAQRQLDQTNAALAAAQAQYDLVASGARPEQIEAAQAQVDAATAAVAVLDAQIAKLTLAAPVDGVVLERSIEPGEFCAPGTPLMVIGELNDLTLTVYVPEDRYGQVQLGQTYAVTVNSFPGQTFYATVSYISDEAEYTPRNVQTIKSRRATVYAVRLAVENPDGLLKPGMPADLVLTPVER